MAAKNKRSECSKCGRLEKRLDKLEAELADVKDELVKAKKNSSNSSMPPSGDIVKCRHPTYPASLANVVNSATLGWRPVTVLFCVGYAAVLAINHPVFALCASDALWQKTPARFAPTAA